ncbi:Signal peptidase complex catalytic subunit SEC11 [Nucleospora cyclopteri]
MLKNTLKMLSTLSLRQHTKQFVSASYSILSSYITWKLLCVLLNNDSPVVCVLTKSMEPGFKRGDILFLRPKPFKCGMTAVYSIKKGEIPIVHRIIKYDYETGNALTQGDNNRGDDVPLYRPGQKMLTPVDLETSVIGYIPYFGMPTIWISSIPGLRQGILVLSALYIYLQRT